MAHHVHRATGLGAWVLINENWYKALASNLDHETLIELGVLLLRAALARPIALGIADDTTTPDLIVETHVRVTMHPKPWLAALDRSRKIRDVSGGQHVVEMLEGDRSSMRRMMRHDNGGAGEGPRQFALDMGEIGLVPSQRVGGRERKRSRAISFSDGAMILESLRRVNHRLVSYSGKEVVIGPKDGADEPRAVYDDRLSVEQIDPCPDRRGASFRKPGLDFAAMKFVVAGDIDNGTFGESGLRQKDVDGFARRGGDVASENGDVEFRRTLGQTPGSPVFEMQIGKDKEPNHDLILNGLRAAVPWAGEAKPSFRGNRRLGLELGAKPPGNANP